MAKARARTRNLLPTAQEFSKATSSPNIAATEEKRRLALDAYVPKTRPAPRDVRELVTDLVIRTPYRSAARDLDVLAAALKNAVYDVHTHGSYDAGRAMSESGLTRWRREELRPRGVSEHSQGDYCSLVRFVARHNGLAPHLSNRTKAPRGVATAPADNKSWSRVLDRADGLPEPWRTDVIMVADLTHGLGLRAQEVGRARADDLSLLPNGNGRLTVANRAGQVREIPVGPLVTRRILQAGRSPGEHLVRPYRSRHNLINRLFERVDQRFKGVKFDLVAARNRYIVNLLGQPIPFGVVCLLADLAPGGHTAQDLARFSRVPTQAEIDEMIRGTWS